MTLKASLLLAFVLLRVSFLGQSPASASAPQTVHVQGTVFNPDGGGVPGTKVIFKSGQVSRTVISDDNGFYQADMPAGLYTMTAQARPSRYSGFALFRRPQFQLVANKDVVLNAHLKEDNCVIDVADNSPEPTPEEKKEVCGAEDLISVPAEHGGRFQLYIRYPRRSRVHGGYVYKSDNIGNLGSVVLVEYNLLTLQADRVSYDAKHRRLVANGQVVVEDESGKTSRTDSLTFKIENGRALSVQ
jgi:hypothetical protein